MLKTAQSRDHFTYADLCRWPEDERWELIDGVAYDMCPAPSRQHQELVLEIARQAANFLLGAPCKAYVAPFDIRLPKADEADDLVDTVVQPDVSVICDPTKLDDAGCRGAPDWVVEVLSPYTAAKDQRIKRDLYERVGVRELWLAHPIDRVLTLYRLVDGAYGRPDVLVLEGETPVEAVPGLVIRWPEVDVEPPLPSPR